MRRLLRTYGELFRESQNDLHDRFVQYHDHTLLSAARERGFGYDNGQNLTDLELLAKLQHFGGATGLIDFTRNPLVALWFSCEDNTCDGTFFVLASAPLPDLTHFSVAPYGGVVTIKEVLEFSRREDEATTWEPPLTGDATPRIIAQQSVFVIDQSRGLKHSAIHAVTIPADAKDKLLDSLSELGITQHSLFVDFHGFASNNRFDYPAAYAVDESFAIGLRFHRVKDYPQAISKYNEYIATGKGSGEVHFHRGNALSEVGEHGKAIEDYNRTIDEFTQELQHVRYLALYNRANAKVRTSDIDGAIKDYNAALTLDPDYKSAIYNRGNTYALSGEHEKAVSDFNRLPGNRDAAFNKGNSLLCLAKLDEAKDAYTFALDEGVDPTRYRDNAEELARLQELIGDNDAEVTVGPSTDPSTLVFADPRRPPIRFPAGTSIIVSVDGQRDRSLGFGHRYSLEGNRPHRGNAGHGTDDGNPFGERTIIEVHVVERERGSSTGDLPFGQE